MPSPLRAATLLFVAACGSALTVGHAAGQADRIRRLLRDTPLIDGHNDVPEQYSERVNKILLSAVELLDPP